ncbi:hypothetical protein LTR56_014394 [Elasticomyces elasticus]|nr:hypothetical protein LTR22_020547 [Elasticomyces elasticus]KAK3636018.1 hypothetical protein LTR56_014394 [Elasticomyces elasticus]KAK4916661.1 hypothetical protein LTR49_015359 [Elasticomyces elasticus]KAK5754935.1 hypothetical protein LTS12_014968 [Elasticomyces elasticus]
MAADSLNEKADSSDVKTAEQQRRGSTSEGELETVLGYKPELERNRSLFTLLFQSLAIAAIPYGVHWITYATRNMVSTT